MADAQELEWQYDALDLRPVERWLAGADVRAAPRAPALQVDVYLDTDDWRFHRAGYALRLRRIGRRHQAEATLKSLEAALGETGLRSRREVSEQLEAADPAVLACSHGPVGERVRAVAGAKRLVPLFEVRTRRRVFALDGDGEVALDETAIRSPGSAVPTRLRRVEIEVPVAGQEALAPLAARLREDCALQPASLSKYEAGLLSAGLRPSEAERFGPVDVEPGMTIGAVALAALRRHFAAMLAREPGTRLGDDIEELHDMRVATRRLRAALTLFADVLPAAAAGAREELGWIGGALGAVRDLDVQLAQHEAWLVEVPDADRAALQSLGAVLRSQRAQARAELLEALDSARYRAFVTRFGRLVRAQRPRLPATAALPARAVAPGLIGERFRRVVAAGGKIGPDSHAAEYHRLRIRAKRLRYALEFLADLFPGETRPVLRRLAELQDVLGAHQDACVAIERLRHLAHERGAELGPATVFAMGEVAERYRWESAALRGRFPAAYERATGKRWRAFERVLAAASG